MVFIDACLKKTTEFTPIWMMRQAGRYLPEYRATRARAKDFVDFCRRPDMACEATLQPIDILDVDAAILFSDILVVPLEMGMNLEFIEKKGPVFHDPIRTQADFARLGDESVDRLGYVYDAVRMIRLALPKNKALIGFAGSPWTLATYMVEGQGTKTFDIIKKMLVTDPALLHAILAKNAADVTAYLGRQIEAGADAVQVFDSWGGALEESSFFEFSWKYMTQIAADLKKKYPDTPVILFSKGVGCYMDKIYGQFEVFGVDWGTPMKMAREKLCDRYALQGNMEPTRLYSREATEEGARAVLDAMKGENGHIFNLGHGMLPDLPVENAKFLVDFVHEYSATLRQR